MLFLRMQTANKLKEEEEEGLLWPISTNVLEHTQYVTHHETKKCFGDHYSAGTNTVMTFFFTI